VTSTTHFRDEHLGAALRALDVPEHGATFFPDLEARLASHQRHPLRPDRRVLAAVAVAAAALVVAGVILPRILGVDGSEVARAADIRARVAAALAGAHTARGEVIYSAVEPRSGKRTTTRQSFVLDAAGDQRQAAAAAGTVSAYDASRGVERAITTSASIGSGHFYAVRTGLAPGPPDQGPSESLLDRQLGTVTRALAIAQDARVRDVEYRDRPAWQLDATVAPNTVEADIDHVSVTVDRATGFPLHILLTLDGHFRSETRVGQLKLDEPVKPTTFSLEFPLGAELLRTDAGFSHVSLRQAASIAGYRPPVPASVPAGFRLATVAAAKSTARTGPGESNPPSRGVVALAYRRGLEQFVVTTRVRGHGDWRDPFAVEGVPLSAEQVHIGVGALAGAPAELVVDPRSLPHLWCVTSHLVVTVAGDLSREQLIAVAKALQ
jgi:hypothetical protein